MKRKLIPCLLALAASLAPSALAAQPPNGGPHASPTEWVAWGKEEQGSGATACPQAGWSGAGFATTCYPTSVTRSEDGTQIRKVYELGPEEDPSGIPRSDFEQEGFHYTLTDLLKQESPEREERFHTETVTLDSKSKDNQGVPNRKTSYDDQQNKGCYEYNF